ncbi:sirohydrochlorin cobaltochelatase [Entomomonas sp. E2T0]|uniref:sirohydrochlorin cobaltochelatase n=1 Tax=Entomomonas sp. E2T0 TaxID=2930213 RepID=UPI002228236C|nr:sirohydrochlorin cobaltochelatase [Entomomonas sp. E2T0]UYZ82678.1 sirohydrochlorin cobaltochelatase [Entomomonas sp. E2T0]
MKKALLVVSFGTSYPETRIKNIETCEQAMRDICPDRDFFRSWTSHIIRRKIAERDQMYVDSPQQALERLIEQGYTDVVIQSLHIINGDEYEKITSEVLVYKDQFERMEIGKPLLTTFADFEAVIEALKAQAPNLQPDERVLFMGHGTTHHTFAAYACIDHLFMDKKLPFIMGAVESYPEIETILERLQRDKVRKVHLMPFMIVAGDHAINDMASDEEDSWNSQIKALGIETECYLQGLGENEQIRALFAQHLLDAVSEKQ